MGRSVCRWVIAGLLSVAGIVHAEGLDKPRFHWIMNCQGCHLADASGSPSGVPNMLGFVSQFLSVEGGRDYLARVPGVAFAPLPDADLAVLLNWTLATFDPEHLPDDFQPYSAEEVARLRARPLVSEAAEYRHELLAELGALRQSD